MRRGEGGIVSNDRPLGSLPLNGNAKRIIAVSRSEVAVQSETLRGNFCWSVFILLKPLVGRKYRITRLVYLRTAF